MTPPLRRGPYGPAVDGFFVVGTLSPPIGNIVPDGPPGTTETVVLSLPIGDRVDDDAGVAIVWRAQGESVAGCTIDAYVEVRRVRGVTTTVIGSAGGTTWLVAAGGKVPGVGMGVVTIPADTLAPGDDLVIAIVSQRSLGADGTLTALQMLLTLTRRA